jgi:hypothetical protein
MKTWKDVSNELRDELLDRFLDGTDHEVLSLEVGISGVTLGRRLREWRHQREVRNKYLDVSDDDGNFEKHWDLFCKYIGRDPKKPIPKGKKQNKKSKSRKIIILCDVHGKPYMPIQKAVADEKPDILVYDGDVFDASAFSRFNNKIKIPIADEMASIRAMLEHNSTFCPRQILTTGNHEDRVFKYFAERVDHEFLPLINWNILDLVSRDIPGVQVAKNSFSYLLPTGEIIKDAFENHWLTTLGDLMVGHANVARKGDTRSVAAFAEWIYKWRTQLELVDPRVIIHAHVHGAGISYDRGGHCIMIEGGYSGEIEALDYTMANGAIGWRAPVLGYTSLTQKKDKEEKWKTDLQTVRFNLV